jgi:hypothetical protein
MADAVQRRSGKKAEHCLIRAAALLHVRRDRSVAKAMRRSVI